jgi:hypothetical protein
MNYIFWIQEYFLQFYDHLHSFVQLKTSKLLFLPFLGQALLFVLKKKLV